MTRQDKTRQASAVCMDNTLDHTFESANRVYDKNQLCPTIPTCGGGGIQPKVIEETRCVGGLNDKQWGKQYHQQDRVYKGDNALAQPANLPEGSYKYIVAMRGRNPENPTDRTAGLPTEQRLEPAPQGIVNTLTTVQKDNLVLEKKIQKVGQISNEGSQCGTVVSEEGLAPTLSAGCHGYANPHILTKTNGFYEQAIETAKNRKVLKDGISPTITTRPEGKKTAILPCVEHKTVYRIRKLTPRECWRLMGYTDTDFDRASQVNSNTQLYKQAGNAIVKQVLMAIFAQMIPESARQK